MSQVYLDFVPLGPGRLYISGTGMTWVDDQGHGQGFEIDYKCIGTYSISRKKHLYHTEPHLYVITGDTPGPDSLLDEGDLENVSEIQFFPVDEGSVDDMYDAISKLIPRVSSVDGVKTSEENEDTRMPQDNEQDQQIEVDQCTCVRPEPPVGSCNPNA